MSAFLPPPDGAPPDADEAAPAPPRPPLDWRPVLLEAFFVVMGVVLALAANEWRQARADSRRAHVALQSIRDELAANREMVAQSLAYHITLADTLRGYAAHGAEAVPDARVFARGFIFPAPIVSTAWETAAATNALHHMPYETVVRLNRAYEQQRTYEFQAEQVGQIIYTRLFNDGYEAVLRNYANLATVVGTFWYRECQLIAAYDETSARLGPAALPETPLPEACAYVLGRG